MSKKVHLKVKDGKVDAHEGAIGGDGGHFDANPGETVKWQGKYEGGDFVVTFHDVSNNLTQGWPFDGTPPTDMRLIVEGDGNPKPELKLRNSDALWKYDVAVTGESTVTPLDPMIIVRDSGWWLDASVLAAIAFVVGAVVATLVRGLSASRER